MNDGLHPHADVDQIYVHSSLGGCDLLSVEDTVMSKRHVLYYRALLYYYLEDQKDVLMKKVLLSGIIKTPDDAAIAPNAFKDHLNVTIT